MIGCGVLALASCSKENVSAGENLEETTNNNNRAAEFDIDALGAYVEMTGIPRGDESTIFYEEMAASRTQTFTVSAESAVSVTGVGGTNLSCGAFNFVNSYGDVIEGPVEIELIEVFDKASMVLLDKATSGVTEDGSGITALVSGGEIYVRATQGGVEVNLIDPMRVTVPTDTPDPDMLKFVEADPGNEDLLWAVAEDGRDMEVEEDRGGEGEGDYVTSFNILPGEWGWTNIDKWAADPCAKTDIFVEVPAGHDPTNTEVYLSYDGDPGRLANFDMWDGSRFTEHYGQICLGLDCHFIAVTNIGGSLAYDIHPATITASHVEVFTSFTPISEAGLIAAINALP